MVDSSEAIRRLLPDIMSVIGLKADEFKQMRELVVGCRRTCPFSNEGVRRFKLVVPILADDRDVGGTSADRIVRPHEVPGVPQADR